MNSSPQFSLNGIDLKKVLTGLLVGLSGVAITVLGMFAGVNFHVVVGGTDFSTIATLLASAVISGLVNLLRKFVSSNQS